MKKSYSILLFLAALWLHTACTDSDYDLSDINTTSRFALNGLTLPLNIDPVQLDLMLDIADDSDIKTDAEGNYYFQKEGTFTSSAIRIAPIALNKPQADFSGEVLLQFTLDPAIKSKMQQYASNKTIGEILESPSLMAQIGINAQTEILDITFSNITDNNDLNFTASNIDANVKRIETLGLDPTTLNISVKLNGVQQILKPFDFDDLHITMPHGLAVTTKAGTTYDPKNGVLRFNDGKCHFDKDYTVNLNCTFTGIDYDLLAEAGMQVFNPTTHTFNYRKACGVSGHTTLTMADLQSTARYADIATLEQAGTITYACHVGFDHALTINAFKGDITYQMDDIVINPVVINNVPDILKENGTNIDLHNPQIYLDIDNHLGVYGIGVGSTLEIKGNNTITSPLTIQSTARTHIAMSPYNEAMYHPQGYTYEAVKDLGRVVGSNDGQTFPEQLNIRVLRPTVPKTTLSKALPLGTDIDGVNGTWEFYTRLSLTDNTKIKYTKVWDDWSDEDLDGLTVNKATVNVTLQKDVALDAENVEFVLLGRKGELRGQTSITGDASQDITFDLAGQPVSEITGARLNVHLKGVNKDINKSQQIRISNLKVTVDGYYDREL